jgi:hypothetical protein
MSQPYGPPRPVTGIALLFIEHVSSHHEMALPRVAEGGHGLQIWRAADRRFGEGANKALSEGVVYFGTLLVSRIYCVE